ncbi:hypothetical protein [Cytobacillus firmus]|uniref:hypothetical protein n=1 Tax=Cytobacillus firmus TaxID=1399 RepID=UPI0018CF5836|nr:hypothetical protein [Cytobacillus firmus]
MINRLIYNGKVYYKVADLAQLFDVSIYKMRNSIKKQGIGAPLPKGSGYGRAVFVLEENVAKIDVNGKSVIVKTKVKESVEKFATVFDSVKNGKNKFKKMKISADGKLEKVKETPVEKTAKQDETVKNENAENKIESSQQKMEKEATPESIEKLQEEHEQLIKKGNALGVKLAKADKFSTSRKITEKHLGQGAVFRNATLDDIVAIRAIVADLEAEIAKWDESLNEAGRVKVSVLNSEIENVDLNNLPKETESTLEQQVGEW